MPRLVRRKPLFERITSMLNPMDFLLWLSEELETRDWDSKLAGTQLGLGMNFVFLLARANSGSTTSSDDDIFGDESSSSWLSLFVYPLVWGMVLFSCINAVYALSRTRKYRMFEANIEMQPSTPSARRVQVQSSPGSSSPLRYLADILTPSSAESRAHPDKKRDVWELSVWDPLPMSLRLFCLFSPGHVLVYLLFLPLAPLDPQPTVTVFNTLVMQVLLSGQLLILSARFAQQAKDNAIIQKEVMNEYNTKFVHPRLHPVVRDVGTQVSEDKQSKARDFVQVGTPTTLIRNSFVTRANHHGESDDALASHNNVMRPQMFTPTGPRRSEIFIPSVNQRGSVLRSSTAGSHVQPSSSTTSTSTSTATGNPNFGGSMGIYTHNRSPLKKAIGMNDLGSQEPCSPRNSREMAAREQRHMVRSSSPTKHAEVRLSSGTSTTSTSTYGSFTGMARNRAQQERYPSRW